MTDAHLSDNQLLRYSRHILLNEIGIEAIHEHDVALLIVSFLVSSSGVAAPGSGGSGSSSR